MYQESSKIDIFKTKLLTGIHSFIDKSSKEKASILRVSYIFCSNSSVKIKDFLWSIFSEKLYSDNISNGFVTIFASQFKRRLLHQLELLLNISQGTQKTSFHKSRANFAVIKVPDFSLASAIKIQVDNQATISFLIGKL
ncbi:MAG: hypothetical protein P1U46_02235 [Patescibacteria group bacterium]|nr:hypothetical protein [Patescibacteria group bacterium]